MKPIAAFRATSLFLLSVLASSSASGFYAATQEERKMCEATIYSRAVPKNQNWTHVHHYCDCVRFTNHAYRLMGKKDKRDFDFYLSEALDGCDYVIEHTSPDFSLLPEIYLQKAVIYSLQKKTGLAAAEYSKAMNGNPRLPRAYIGLAEFFLRNKDKKNALETVTRGLQFNPTNKGLMRMYKELGGAMPYPNANATDATAPVDKPVAATAETTATPAPSTGAPSAAATAPVITNAPEQPKESTAAPATPKKGANKYAPIKVEIGSSTNPFCRFCPDIPPVNPAATPSTPGVDPKAD